jgi:hypothetical protein
LYGYNLVESSEINPNRSEKLLIISERRKRKQRKEKEEKREREEVGQIQRRKDRKINRKKIER